MTGYINQFSGAGGWDIAARKLGLKGTGIEKDPSAMKTTSMVGFPVYWCDINSFSPGAYDPWTGLISSPPCQTFTVSGSGQGRSHIADLCKAIRAGDYKLSGLDERTALVLQPLRFLFEAKRIPRWIAMEQVPQVQPIFDAYADFLRSWDYSVDTGILHAEQYGVPQTRKRSFLVACLDRHVHLPEPTHSKYYPHDPERLDPGVKKWVTMAETLGWEEDYRLVSNYNHGNTGERGFRLGSQPSTTITSKAYNMRVEGWPFQRPCTTIVGDARVTPPGRHDPNVSGYQNGSLRLTQSEAGVLQTFPADYPWQGTKKDQFLQIGNAVPPLLAEAVLKEVI